MFGIATQGSECRFARLQPPTAKECMVVGAGSSCDELADTTGLSDTLLGDLGELLSADNARNLGELALAENLEVALKKSFII